MKTEQTQQPDELGSASEEIRLDYARTRLAGLANSFCAEDDLQTTVASILTTCDIDYDREAILSKADRIDFLVRSGGKRIGIECKIRPGGMAVWRQLSRYAAHLDELILITTGPLDRTLILYKTDGTVLPLTVYELWKNIR